MTFYVLLQSNSNAPCECGSWKYGTCTTALEISIALLIPRLSIHKGSLHTLHSDQHSKPSGCASPSHTHPERESDRRQNSYAVVSMRVDTLAEEFKEKRGSTLVGSSTSWGSEDSVDDGMNEIRHICAPYRSGCRRPKKMEAGFPVDCADAESVLVSRSGNRGIRGERVLETEAGRNGYMGGSNNPFQNACIKRGELPMNATHTEKKRRNETLMGLIVSRIGDRPKKRIVSAVHCLQKDDGLMAVSRFCRLKISKKG
ncbi:hypothetical protein HPP92_000365 [Vanilla planifolia]|uniref:Uncharacterized protein n=1 Tax=Vanilla planifolia TaxID=51239 RepID=A0A835S0G9_VANPL|nr:hypothetical protein HPP92_000365 [Vanilla planifolia]